VEYLGRAEFFGHPGTQSAENGGTDGKMVGKWTYPLVFFSKAMAGNMDFLKCIPKSIYYRDDI